jgi:hypothetical protein
MSSTLKVRLQVAINHLSGQLVFPEYKKQTDTIGRLLQISSGSGTPCKPGKVSFKASDVLEKRPNHFLGISSHITLLRQRFGNDLTSLSKKEKKAVKEWLDTIQDTFGFPESAMFPCTVEVSEEDLRSLEQAM